MTLKYNPTTWYLISHLLTSYVANKEENYKYANTKLALMPLLAILCVRENPDWMLISWRLLRGSPSWPTDVASEVPLLITVRKQSCGKVMFLHLSVSHSIHRGVYIPACIKQIPLGRHPLPSACWDTPPAQCMLGYTPFPSACWGTHPPSGHCCGRYTSYCNAFLF